MPMERSRHAGAKVRHCPPPSGDEVARLLKVHLRGHSLYDGSLLDGCAVQHRGF
jgi:hypothetical protein